MNSMFVPLVFHVDSIACADRVVNSGWINPVGRKPAYQQGLKPQSLRRVRIYHGQRARPARLVAIDLHR